MADERLTLPIVSEASWTRYKRLRDESLNTMRLGVLPHIKSAIKAYDNLDASLSDENGGGYEGDDQTELAAYHPQITALVAPAIASIRAHMEAILAETAAVDAAFVAAGKAPLFEVDV